MGRRSPPRLGGEKASLLASLLQDLHVALRSLRRSPGFTLVVILTLALGIGANTAIFSVVEGVLLRPMPYPDPDRLVRVSVQWAGDNGDRWGPWSDRGYWHFANNNRSFEGFGALSVRANLQWPLTGEGPPLQVDVAPMTVSAFELIGVLPQRGRFPSAEEDVPDGPAVALISHGLWVNRYSSDPSILGRTIELNGITREVIGVMRADYDFPNRETDVWIPYQLDPASDNFGGHHLAVIARLAPGVTIEAAISDGERLFGRFGELGYGPAWLTGRFTGEVRVRTLSVPIFGFGMDLTISDSTKPLPFLFGTVLFVLLIACSNVANLLLVRAESRTRERAVRTALGSGRGRLIRYVMTECMLLSLIGGAAGVLLAYVATRALVILGPANIPRLGEVGINGTVLLFTIAISVFAGLLIGVLPALRASSKDVFVALSDGARGSTFGRERHRVRSTLVVVQVALVLVLLVGSGLMVRSFQELLAVDPGFDAKGVMTFRLLPPPSTYPEGELVTQFYDELVERLEAIPGATSAGGIIWAPGVGGTRIYEFPVPRGEPAPAFSTPRVTPGYFETMGIPLVEGREFHPDDHNLRLPSLIISESIKQQYWPDESALGKEMRPSYYARAQIVGVVGDVHRDGLDVRAVQTVYVPMLNARGSDGPRFLESSRGMMMTVRADGDANSLIPGIRAALQELGPDVPIADLRSMEDILGDSLSPTSFTMTLLVLASLIALFLGSVGIYGVLSYVVGRRTGEIGVRMALGARAAEVSRLVVRQGGKLVLVGLAIGLIGALALTRVMDAILFNVSPTDPVTYVGVTVLLLAIGLLATYLPARRAASVDPVEALRAE